MGSIFRTMSPDRARLEEIREIKRLHLRHGASYRSECAMAVAFAKNYLNGQYPNLTCTALTRLARMIYARGRMGDNPGVMRTWNHVESILEKMYGKLHSFLIARSGTGFGSLFF